jgi:pyrimidine-nucleoside phosphorylase
MAVVDLIIKKRQGLELSQPEIAEFVRGVTDGAWKDYQISAMLMAMFIQGLNNRETADLTLAMAASGDQFDLSGIPGVKVDKHSTGGVADTVTLIAAPLVAACDVPVIKLSGRGLGFTGGTIDKLESIPGLRVQMEPAEALELATRSRLLILAQSDRLTPADKKLYALRDVTGTVDSIPLIAASIMSKKIAAGADAIVLDVKCGSGAFMRDLESARRLAATMVGIGRMVGRQVVAVISGMEQPLGMNIGNALEVIEAIEVLKGHVDGDLLDVSLVLASEMLRCAGLAAGASDARAMLLDKIQSGAGLAALRRMIAVQGGDPQVIYDYSLLPQAAVRMELAAEQAGLVTGMDTAAIGRAFIETGGGRKTKEDPIDYGAGIILHKRIGEAVEPGQPLAEIRAASPEQVEAAAAILRQAIRIGPNEPEPVQVILDRID